MPINRNTLRKDPIYIRNDFKSFFVFVKSDAASNDRFQTFVKCTRQRHFQIDNSCLFLIIVIYIFNDTNGWKLYTN